LKSLDYWIPNCSPYISKFVYDIDRRTLTIECVNNVEDFIPNTRIVCESILTFSETTNDEDYDDNCIDGLIDVVWNESNKTLLVYTDKKEIILSCTGVPRSEVII
jgi:hypothetical protein